MYEGQGQIVEIYVMSGKYDKYMLHVFIYYIS